MVEEKKEDTSEDLYLKWEKRVSAAKRKYKEEVGDKLKRWRDYYKGKQWGGDYVLNRGFRDRMVDNMVFSNVTTIIPAINFSNPNIYVEPKKKPYNRGGVMFDTGLGAKKWELLLNYDYKECDVKKVVDKVLLDSLLGPWGIVQTGYFVETSKVSDQEPREVLEREGLYVQRLPPEDMIVDAECKDSTLREAKWVGIRWVKRKSDLEKSGLYKDSALVGLESNVSIESETSVPGLGTFGEGKSEWERVEGWDIWDGENKRLITIVEGHDKILRDIPWPLEYDGGYPFDTLYFNENPDGLYPVSDVDIYMSAQDELNAITTYQLEHIRKVSRRKYLSKLNSMEQEEKDKLVYGEDGVVCEVKGDLDSSFKVVSDASISQDIGIVRNNIKDTIRQAAGTAQYEQGSSEKYDTATEPSLIAQSVTIRRNQRRAILENFIKKIVRKMAAVRSQTIETHEVRLDAQQYQQMAQQSPQALEQVPKSELQYVDKHVQMVLGGDGEEKVLLPWMNIKKEDIEGEYDFSIEIGSTLPINQETRKRDAVQRFQMLSQNPAIDQTALIKDLLSAFQVKNMDELLKPQEVMAQESQAQQEAAQAEMEMKRQTDLMKTQMKTETAKEVTGIKAQTQLEVEQMKAHGTLAKTMMDNEVKKDKIDADSESSDTQVSQPLVLKLMEHRMAKQMSEQYLPKPENDVEAPL